jgi:Tol biopolymer transport system component
MSGSGTKIVVGTLAGGGVVYISVDTGTSFPSKAAFGTGEWQDVKYSRDGSTVYAAADRFASIGALMKSTDDGATAADVTPNGGANAVSSVCCSADGSYVVAGTTDGHIWTSSNAGGAWTDRGANPDASGFGAQLLVCSDDGQTVLFSGGNNDNAYKSVNGGAIWTSQTPTCMSNPIGSISADGSKMAFSDWSASTGFWVFS